MVEIDLFVLTTIYAVGSAAMAIGFISIYSNIKTAKQKARTALDKSMAEFKADVREYITLKIDVMSTKVDFIREEMRQMHQLEARAKDNRLFFTTWNQRIEDRIERLRNAADKEEEEEESETDG